MEFHDKLETRDPQQREQAQFAALTAQIENAQNNAPGWARILAGIDARAVLDRSALALLPVTRKSHLHELQKQAPPFAGLAAVATGELARVYSSPGPVYDPEGRRADYW